MNITVRKTAAAAVRPLPTHLFWTKSEMFSKIEITLSSFSEMVLINA